jgi:hypothetical protein
LIRLDRRIPFVAAALEGNFDSASAILQDAERRHGLQWVAIQENRPEDNRIEWYQAHLWPFLSETHMVLAGGELQATDSLLDTAGVNHSPTWRYWGDVVASWANQFWIPRPAGLGRTGQHQARSEWQYIDFYDHAYLSAVIEGYDDWRAAVWRVLSLTGGGSVPAVPGVAADGEGI